MYSVAAFGNAPPSHLHKEREKVIERAIEMP